jgi:hypothetical protein
MTISARIRKQLEQPDGLTPELLEPLALEYGRMVSEANRRLEECVAFLRRGLRSEALQRAAIKPHVLDVATELDFPEIADWVEILQLYGIELPENLDRDAVARLNEAFVEEQPLEELLRQHRRMAIAKAPLAWRVGVLRKIAAIDMMNPVWIDDLKDWEVARINQITQEWKSADQSNLPLEDIVKLREELESSAWIVKPPEDLTREISKTAKLRVHESKIAVLQELAVDIHNAYAAGDEHAGASLAVTWASILQELQQPPPRNLLDEVAPALEWINERNQERDRIQEHEMLCSKFDLFLKQPKIDEGELQRAYQTIVSLQLGIDPLLETRFDARLREIQQADRRRQVLAISSIIAATLSLMVAGGLWYWNRNYQLAVADTVAKLSELIDKEQYAEAQSIYTTIQSQAPSVANSPQIASLTASLELRLAEEKKRSEDVVKLIDAADVEPVEALDVNKIIVAEKAVQTDTEKSRIAGVRARFERYQQSLAEEEFRLLKTELQKIDVDLERIQNSSLSSINETELDNMLVDLKGMLNRFPRAMVAGRQVVDLATSKATSLRDSVRKQRREMAQKQTLLVGIRAGSTVREHQTQLQRFIDAMPSDSLSLEFMESLKEKDLWQSVEEWNSWCSDAVLQTTGKLEPSKAATMLERCDRALQTLDGLPGQEAVAVYKKKYESYSTREELLDNVIENLEDSVILEIVTLESSKDVRSFIHYDAVAEVSDTIRRTTSNSLTNIPVISDAEGGVSNRDFRGMVTISDEPRQFIRTLIRDLKNSRKSILADWENEWMKILDQIVTAPKVDSKIKELLLARISNTAQDGSSTMMRTLAKLQDELFKTSEIRGRWYTEMETNDRINKNLFSEFQEAKKDLGNSLKEEVAAFQGLSKARLMWAGSLLRDSTGAVASSLYRGDIPDGTLVVVSQDSVNAGRGRVVEVGYVRDRVGELQGNKNELVPGRPLFWIRDNPKTK